MHKFLWTVDLKSALGKQRREGKSAPLEPLTKVQRIYIGRLIEKHGDDYKVYESIQITLGAMFNFTSQWSS